MSQFNLWFAYYDSLFLKQNPKLSRHFYFDLLQSQSLTNKNILWPKNACSEISTMFELLQSFVKDSNNWVISNCKQSQLKIIQEQVNNLIYFLNMQKYYAYCFWKSDVRRLQASVVHFYTFLQLFVKAIIPYPTMTLFQCKSANKLCINIKNLQKIINQISKFINPIAKFLSHQKFKQESKLVKNFLQNWMHLMKNLPKIKRNKFNHVHRLMKYICLSNPIEICVQKYQLYAKQNRKKSNTVGAKVQSTPHQNIFKHRSNIRLDTTNELTPHCQQILTKNGQKIKRQKYKMEEQEMKNLKKSLSCDNFRSLKLPENDLLQFNIDKKFILFELPIQLVQYAIKQQIRNKKKTYQSLSTLQNKYENLSKNRTYTTNHMEIQTQMMSTNGSMVNQGSIKKRQKAMSYFQSRSPRKKVKSIKATSSNNGSQSNLKSDRSKSRSRKKTRYYDQESERNQQVLSQRSSKQSTIRRRQMSIMTMMLKKDNKNDQADQQAQFRGQQILFAQNKKFSINQTIFIKNKSKWDIVRKYFKQRLIKRKIQKVLLLK